MAAVLDPFVVDHAPGPLVELHPALIEARVALAGALELMAPIPDERLTSAWTWNGYDVDVRYGFYRALEMLESATSPAKRSLGEATSSEARDAVAAATAARWDVQGILATLPEADLDADPGGGEWTCRQTAAHIISGQRGYAWGSAWWISSRDRPRSDGPQRPPEEEFAGLPDEATEATGSLADIRARFDDVLDATSSRFATLTEDEFSVMAGWSGFPATIRFRMWRWSSHIQEHTVQLEKTLDMLGRRTTETQRLVRLVTRAFGRLEEAVYMRPPAALDRSTGDAPPAARTLEAVAGELAALGASVRAAADAGVPAGDW